MKFLYSWLNEFVDCPADVDSLAEALTMAGLEVESIEHIGSEIQHITTGRIDSITKHPDADKLVITQVNDGKNTHQIVTGASNISEGDVVPISLPGAVVAGGMAIKSSKLRGVDSHGMLCSEKELGVSDEATGIWILDPSTPLGIDFITYANIKETVLDIAILPNRGDCQSVIGLAREIAALTGGQLKEPAVTIEETAIENPFSVTVKEADLCPLYTGRYVSGLNNTSSPLSIKRRLDLSGIRPISLIVDISNYVLLEMGHPLHMFDAALCETSFTIEKAGEKQQIKTLDDETRALDSQSLIVKNGPNIVAAAGIMGASNTEVSDSTTEVFLEAAYFDAIHTRQSATKLGLRTESSIRFEKGININTVDLASKRAVQLLQELSGASVSSSVSIEKNDSSALFSEKTLTFSAEQINQFLGTSYSESDIHDVLTTLGFRIQGSTITVPSWRQQDIEAWPCLAEEIARLKGFDSIPSQASDALVTLEKDCDNAILQEKTHHYFVNNGFSELCTYPMISIEEATRFDESNINDHCVLANPITPELAVMRSSLLPSHLKVHQHHSSRQMHDSAFFEIAKTFQQENESLRLAASVKGSLFTNSYLNEQRSVSTNSFEQLKAVIEGFSQHSRCELSFVKAEAASWAHPHIFAQVKLGNTVIGSISELHPGLLKDYDIPETIAYLELDLLALAPTSSKRPTYQSFSSFPHTRRDIAMLAPKDLAFGDILSAIHRYKHNCVQDVFLFDLFESEQLETGHQSVAVALIYQDDKGTLSDKKVNGAHEHLCKQLSNTLPITIR